MRFDLFVVLAALFIFGMFSLAASAPIYSGIWWWGVGGAAVAVVFIAYGVRLAKKP